jgi:hypothetical protein
MEKKLNGRKREPSRLALQLTEAFAPCAEWSQVRVQRGAGGRRGRVGTIRLGSRNALARKS